MADLQVAVKELELFCPVTCAWFDADSLDDANAPSEHVRVRLCDPEHCRAAGASFAKALNTVAAPTTRLRPRSVAMQDSQCQHLEDGTPVLVLRRGPVPQWADATLLSVSRFPHLPNGDCQVRIPTSCKTQHK